jgi:hypothetical protein
LGKCISGDYAVAIILAKMVRTASERAKEKGQEVRCLEEKIKVMRRRVKIAGDRQRLRRLLPDGVTLEKMMRYESHWSRQLFVGLHEPERLQSARVGGSVTPSAALDVNMSVSSPALDASLENPGHP